MTVDILREFLASTDWQQIQELLNENADVSILWVVGSSGTSMQKFEESYPEICQLIRKSAEGLRRCQNSHHARFQEVKRTGLPAVSACYCGLLGFALPFILDGQVIGVAGGCHHQSEFPITMEKCAEISISCDVDIKEIIACTKKIKHIPKVEQKRLLNILSVFVGMASPLMKWMNKSLLTSDIENQYNMYLLLLGEVCKIATFKLDLEEILKTVTGKVKTVLVADACSVYVLDQAELVLTSTSGLPDVVVGQRIKVGDGIIGHVAEKRLAIAIEDVTHDPETKPLRITTGSGTKRRTYRSVLSVPLMVQDKLVGVIDARTFKPRLWTQIEIGFLSAIAEQVARIIEKSVPQ